IIQALKLTLRDLYLDLAGTRTKYTKDHPFVVDIQNKIDQTKELIQKEMARVFSSETTSLNPLHETVMEKLTAYYADIAAYESQNQVFPKIIDKYESELMTLPRKTSAFTQLSLTVSVTQDIYDALLKYQYQVGLAESTALSNIYLVEPALAPRIDDAKHKHPSLSLNMMVAILLGTTFGIGASLLMEYVDDTIRTPEDVNSFKGLTFLGSVMKQKKKEPGLISTIDPRSPLRETFRTLRNSIRYATLDKMPKSIVITSSIDKEGKSFLASNLAISIANEGKRVLIVDGDMRRPSVHKYFNLTNDTGLTNFLVGDADIKAIQLPSGIEGLSVIPTGPLPPDPVRLVESKKMQQLLKDITGSYDLVIVDSPSVMVASDSIVFGGWTDGMVIVIESGTASRRHFAEVLELAKKANINLIGAVLNKFEGRETMLY
ncbi:MAG TPA: polysaccharide biosynthesis tyrosine autokinase, partial [Candidatus Brocadiales bacterium]|nr:polysaccharide biosynthesis tyrosine autokinase [Candidatus Brocadiales bacterium]